MPRHLVLLQQMAQRAGVTVHDAGKVVLIIAVCGTAGGAFGGLGELATAGVGAGLLIVFSLPFLRGRASIDVQLSLSSERIRVGEESNAVLDATNRGRLPLIHVRLAVAVGATHEEIRLAYLPGGGHTRCTVPIRGDARGVVQIGPVSTIHGDPLGLFQRNRTWRQSSILRVHPRYMRLPLTSRGSARDLAGASYYLLTNADLTLSGVREGTAGDSLNQVHWKSTARMGKLMVREYQSTQCAPYTVLLDTTGYANTGEYELAIQVVASLTISAMHHRYPVQVQVGCARAAVSELDHRTPQRLLDSLAELGPPANRSHPGMWLLPVPQYDRRVFLVTGTRGSTSLRGIACNGGDMTIIACAPDLPARHVRHAAGEVLQLGRLHDLLRVVSR